MNVKVPVLFNGNCFPKTNDFSWLRPLQAVTYAVKVVVSKKWCKIDTFLLHTNGKYHMAYRFVLFAMTFDDLGGHSRVAGLVKCNLKKICGHFAFQLMQCVVRSLGDSRAPCYYNALGGRTQYCDERVYCMSVCLCTGISQELSELHNRTLPILCLLPVVYSDWVIFWQLCYTLCTSGFVNDAIFALSRPEKCNVSGASAQSDSPVIT